MVVQLEVYLSQFNVFLHVIVTIKLFFSNAEENLFNQITWLIILLEFVIVRKFLLLIIYPFKNGRQ